MKEHFLGCEVVRISFTAEPPLATATLITENYFSSRSFSSSAFGFFWDSSISKVLHCINLQSEPQLGVFVIQIVSVRK